MKTKFVQWVDQLQPERPADSAQTQMTIAAALHQGGQHRRRTIGIIVAAAAAALIVGSGIVVPSVNQAFTQVPVVGRFFALFNDDMGSIVESSGRDQKLNVSRSSNGMKMTLNSAVMQGMSVAITGTISGVDGQKDDWFNYWVAKGGVHFEQDSMDLRRIGHGKYRFYLNGTVPYAASQHAVKLPLVFDDFIGHSGRWAFNLVLKPNAATERKLSGSTQLAGGRGRVQLVGVESYAGGTSLLKVRQTVQQAGDGLAVTTIRVNGNDYMLDANAIALDNGKGKTQLVGYKIKTLPATVRSLKLRGYYTAPELSARLRLDKLNGVTVQAKRSATSFTIHKVTKTGAVVKVLFSWQGSRNHYQFSEMAKNEQFPLALMATTYRDNGNDSVFGDDYMDIPDTSEGSQDHSIHYRLMPSKKLIEARFDTSKKTGLRDLPLSKLQLQVNFLYNENISFQDVMVPLTK